MSEQVKNFVDIMEPRKRQGDAFGFMSRYWNPQKAYLLGGKCTPQDLKDAVASSLYIESIAEAVSCRTGESKDQLQRRVLEIMEEMGLEKKMYVVRWLGIFFIKTVLMMKTGVFVNEQAIFKLKSEMGKNPVIFLPTHRSYADFCLMTYLCFHYEIDLPAVAAGMDFHGMVVLGRVMRDTSAFYMRRTVAGDPLYAATLRQYVRTLVTRFGAPVEFFLEGTRSRSNKSMPPKFGLMTMALLPLFCGEVSDVTIVPVNISYDRLMEHSLFSYEHLGVPKPKESTGALIKAMNVLNDHFGNAYVNIGQPFSVKEYFNGDLLQTSELSKPVDLQQLSPEQFGLVQELAEDVITMQQKCTVVTIFNLIAVVLMQSLVRNTVLSAEDLIENISWLMRILRGLGAEVFEADVRASVERVLHVHRATAKFDKKRNLRLISSLPTILSNEVKKKMKGHILKPETMVNAVPIIQLQLYVNPVLHYLIPVAIVTVITANERLQKEQLALLYGRLRRLLRHEYFYIDKHENTTLENILRFCLSNEVLIEENGYYTVGNNTKLRHLLESSLWPSLSSLAKCAEVMTEQGSCEHRAVLKHIQERVERTAGCHPYCLSLEASANCLHGLVLEGALMRDKREDKSVYSVVPEKMEEIYSLVSLVLPNIAATFDDSNVVIIEQRGVLSRL